MLSIMETKDTSPTPTLSVPTPLIAVAALDMGLLVSTAKLPNHTLWSVLWVLAMLIAFGNGFLMRRFRRQHGLPVPDRSSAQFRARIPRISVPVFAVFALLAVQLLVNWPAAWEPWHRVISGLVTAIIAFPLLKWVSRDDSTATVAV